MASKGKCYYCNNIYTKSGMTRHLNSCAAKREIIGKSLTGDLSLDQGYFALKIQDDDREDYWMQILIRADATLKTLDDFLRGIWMECCGHTSCFDIGWYTFESGIADEASQEMDEFDRIFGMDIRLSRLFSPDSEAAYTYDYKTSSRLSLKVMEYVEAATGLGVVEIMARNLPPVDGAPNSPRAGICAYAGDDRFDWKAMKFEDYSESKEFEEFDINELMEEEAWGEMEAEIRSYDFGNEQRLTSPVGLDTRNYSDDFDDDNDYYDYMMSQAAKRYELMAKNNYEPIAPCSLKTALQRLKKDDLKEICRAFAIPKLSQHSKVKLIVALELVLPDLMLQRLKYMTSAQLMVCKRLADGGGCLGYDEVFDQAPEATAYIDSVLSMLIFVGGQKTEGMDRLVCVMPDEILEKMKSVDLNAYTENAERNDLWVALAKGLLYYYGAATPYTINGEIQRLTGREIDQTEFMTVMEVDHLYEQGFMWFGTILVYDFVEETAELLDEVRKRPQLEYKTLTTDELIQASKEDFYPVTQAIENLKWLFERDYEMEPEELDDIILEILDQMDEGVGLGEIIAMLSQYYQFDNMSALNEFMSSLTEVYNHHRQWALKGHSPSEISRQLEKQELTPYPTASNWANQAVPNHLDGPGDLISFQTGKKIGRNDPCPCGSGRKYKHCCGK